jgi:hypothetical protein
LSGGVEVSRGFAEFLFLILVRESELSGVSGLG